MHDDARFSVGFLCLRCTTKTVIKISWWEATTNLSFSLNFWMNSFKIVEISLPSHRKCTKHIRTEGRIISSWDQTLYTDISFWFRSSNDAYRKYTGAWNVSFWTVCMPAYKVAKVADQGTTGRTRGLQTEQPFSIMQDFWQSSEAVGLSQVRKMLRQLTGQILLR